jgi:rubrerythrin
MAFNFNADDIFEIAEKIEENGAAFYNQASEKISNEHFKKLLSELSFMEDEHRKTFSAMRASLSDKEKDPTVFDPMNESALYLKALADLRVFHQLQIDMSSIESTLFYAINAEKDSIVFYDAMKSFVPDRLGKEKIDNIINEEKKHLQVLGNELIALKKQ